MMATSPELISKHMASATTRSRRSSSCGSSSSDCSDGSMPDMISLQSFPESDDESPFATVRLLTRSIFGSYWSSPSHKNTLEVTTNDDENEVAAKLPMPLVNDPVTDDGEDSISAAAIKIVQASFITPKKAPRRQILPTPPPHTAISSSLLLPKRKFHQQQFLPRKTFSTTALLRGSPHQSCLRKSRYSCSAIATRSEAAATAVRRNHGFHDLHRTSAAVITRGIRPSDVGDEPKKSVKFFAQVSVFEFPVPPEQQRSQKGWDNYFR
mmetsp:Transcript_38753/g.69856  ORF Transcript_38753/g.69856 Transcript_38753/m.69856 type:complete len:267 (+) Transcript_38753:205-1005(+)